jgi:hypothetical protein
MMQGLKTLALLAGALGLAACADSRPPMAGANPGTAAPPLQQRAAEQPHSGPVSAGQAEISGARGGGRPDITRSGGPSGDLGGVPPSDRLRSRSN